MQTSSIYSCLAYESIKDFLINVSYTFNVDYLSDQSFKFLYFSFFLLLSFFF